MPIEESSTPPLDACLYISFIVSPRQFAFSRSAQSLLIILSAWVGQKETQRWQSTHFASSLIMTPFFSS